MGGARLAKEGGNAFSPFTAALRLLASQNSGVGPGPNIDFEIRHHSKITSDRFSLTTRHYNINILGLFIL